MGKRGQIRIGTSGWIYNHWRGVFYPPELAPSRWFPFYARHFDTVEINNSFYRLPSPQAVAGWRDQAPPGFIYALKASRFLTHLKKLKDPEEPLQNVLGRARILGQHLGPILYQLPPHWRCDIDRLRAFIACLPRQYQHVFEFRDPSWCQDRVQNLLLETAMSFCIHDSHGLRWPRWVTGPIAYIRFHGPSEVKYAGSYSRAHLRAWAKRLRQFAASGHDVYAYFNNDAEGHAVTNARQLQTLLPAAQ